MAFRAALIEESIAKSNEGSTKLQKVTAVIQAITESATKVKTLVDEVSLGSQEQARGIEQISRAIAQMDQPDFAQRLDHPRAHHSHALRERGAQQRQHGQDEDLRVRERALSRTDQRDRRKDSEFSRE